ncbi:MAG: hypothetical protein V1889_01940 [archaeon]
MKRAITILVLVGLVILSKYYKDGFLLAATILYTLFAIWITANIKNSPTRAICFLVLMGTIGIGSEAIQQFSLSLLQSIERITMNTLVDVYRKAFASLCVEPITKTEMAIFARYAFFALVTITGTAILLWTTTASAIRAIKERSRPKDQ